MHCRRQIILSPLSMMRCCKCRRYLYVPAIVSSLLLLVVTKRAVEDPWHDVAVLHSEESISHSVTFDPDNGDVYDIENKLQKCFNSLNMKQLSWNKAKGNALAITRWLRTILPRNQRRSTERLSACWNTSFALKSVAFDRIFGHVGNEIVNFSIPKYFGDRWKLYPTLLLMRSGIKQGMESKLTCIPRVFIPGISKSGTTSLDSMVNSHPKVEHGLVKEPRWWAPFSKTPNHRTHLRFETPYFVKYLLHYNQAIHKLIEEKDLMLLDSSTSMFTRWFNVGPGQTYEDLCLVPTVLSTILPDLKMIVIIRDPLEFLYSSFWYYCSNYVSRGSSPILTREQELKGPHAFHLLVIRRLKVFKKCMTKYPIERCTFEQQFLQEEYSNNFTCGVTPIGNAIYYVQIKRWLSVIPQENFIFISSTEFFDNQLGVTRKIWNFLGLQQPRKEELKVSLRNNSENKHYDYKNDPKLFMLPETKRILEEFYEPHNKILAEILGNQKFYWQYKT